MTLSATLAFVPVLARPVGAHLGSSATAPAAGSPAAPATPTAPADKLGDHDRDLLAQAREAGAPTVTVLLATEQGRTGSVDAGVARLGGTVGYRNDKLGYVRATVPAAKVEQAVALPAVRKADLKEDVARDDPRPDRIAATDPAADNKPVLGRQFVLNPFLPSNETGAALTRLLHPNWDGRGVTIGVLDSGVDLDHPALQTTSTGQPKIIDWITSVDPLLEGDLSWRPMLDPVTGPTFSYAGRDWHAPAGSFLMNTFEESATLGSELDGDVNRDGDTTDSFGVLYRPTDGAVWVDENEDGDFTDGPLLRPYKDAHQVEHFGTDRPGTDVVETVPFVVEVRKDVDLSPIGQVGETADYVNIGLPEDAHGSHVAGIAAGHHSAIADGAAPGAQIVSSRACTWGGACTNVALTEGMIDLVANHGVDLVNMSIGSVSALNDGTSARAELYDRLIADYGVQIFLSAGNEGPGLNTISDPAVASDAISVGASISWSTWLADYATLSGTAMGVLPFSSTGPREDGGLKPDLVAPGAAISSVPRWLKQPEVAEVPYSLPIGYALFQGTSMASPQAVGAAAILLSAAEARGQSVTPAQLRKALRSAARPIDGVPAHAQGMGRVDVLGALAILRHQPRTDTYTSRAPVCTALSAQLTTPGSGTGYYNRCGPAEGGVRVGQATAYDLVVTRATGPAGDLVHKVRWRAGDGTFSAPAWVVLPLGTPVTVPVSALPMTEGVHSAVLQLDDPDSPGIELASLQTVVVARPLEAPAYGTALVGSVDRNQTTSMFVAVPAGTPVLQVALAGLADGSQVRFVATDPEGSPRDSTASFDCFTVVGDAQSCPPLARAYVNPMPGVWELSVEARRTTPALANPFTLSVAAQGVTVSPAVRTLPDAVIGTSSPVSWSVTNRFGPTPLTVVGGPAGSSFTERGVIADTDVLSRPLEVPAGATLIEVTIGNAGDPDADLDLALVDQNGDVVAVSAGDTADERIRLADPAPGSYTVEVTGFSIPQRSTDYDYRDAVTAAHFGSLQVPATALTLEAGATATVDADLLPAAAPGDLRAIFGEITVLNSAGTRLGSARVEVAALSG